MCRLLVLSLNIFAENIVRAKVKVETASVTRKLKSSARANLAERTKRGKHCLWTEASMLSAIQAVNHQGMSQRMACQTYNVPQCTLQVRLSGKTEIGTKPGHPTNLSVNEEKKLVDFACNRAALGLGFGRQQFLNYAAAYASKHKRNNSKLEILPKKWWQGMQNRHSKITLRQPEATAAVRHQCMDAVKVGKYFLVLKRLLEENNLKTNHIPYGMWMRSACS